MEERGSIRIRQVVGFPTYRVSEDGVIHNDETGHVLSQWINSGGYPYVTLVKDKKAYSMAVHRVIAKAFIPNPDNLPEVNHKDRDKTNNSLSNLEWCTRQENAIHAIAKKCKFTSPDGELVEVFNVKDFSLSNGLQPSCMIQVSNGNRIHHKGWKLWHLGSVYY